MALLRRKVQYHVLTNLRKAIPRTWENHRLINEMFEKYPKGFVVHDSGKAKNRKGIVRYIVVIVIGFRSCVPDVAQRWNCCL